MVEWPGKENDRARGEFGLFQPDVKLNFSEDEDCFFDGSLEIFDPALGISNNQLNCFESGLNYLDEELNLSNIAIM